VAQRKQMRKVALLKRAKRSDEATCSERLSEADGLDQPRHRVIDVRSLIVVTFQQAGHRRRYVERAPIGREQLSEPVSADQQSLDRNGKVSIIDELSTVRRDVAPESAPHLNARVGID
jgi:hypothetical protein